MIREKFKEFFKSLTLPDFDWVQVGVSSYCNAQCTYCPHPVYSDAWSENHMSLHTFRNIIPAFERAKFVHLQGWGEPFLNPYFFEMVDIAKGLDCEVGVTTNGMSLDDEKIVIFTFI